MSSQFDVFGCFGESNFEECAAGVGTGTRARARSRVRARCKARARARLGVGLGYGLLCRYSTYTPSMMISSHTHDLITHCPL